MMLTSDDAADGAQWKHGSAVAETQQ